MGTKTFELPCCIRGYHVNKDIWSAVLGEHLVCEREISNQHDMYAVAVKLPANRKTIGHLPRKISRVCSLFIRRGGSISCIVTGRRQYSSDLPQGGLHASYC